MPTDYKKLRQARETSRALGRKVAVINKLSDPELKPSEKLATIELITGKTIQPKQDPIQKLLKEQSAIQALAPIVDRIDQLPIVKSDDKKLCVAHTPANVLTGDDLAVYEKYDFPPLNEVAKTDQRVIQEGLRQINKINRNLGRQKGVITRRMKKQPATEFDLGRYDELNRERMSIDKYRKQVLTIVGKSGDGVVSIGQYQIPTKRLKRDNVASVRYGKSNKLVPAFNATKVSDNVKKVLLKDRLGGDLQLTAGEKAFLDKLYANSGQVITPSKARVVRGSGVFTSIGEIQDKVRVLLGQLEAGNTSNALKNELAELLHYLFKHRKIKKADYTKLINSLS